MLDLIIKRIKESNYLASLLLMSIRGVSLVTKFMLTLYVAKFMSFEELGYYGIIGVCSIVIPIITSLSIMQMISRRAVTESYQEISLDLNYYGRFIGLIYSLIIFSSLLLSKYLNLDPIFLSIILLVILLEHLNNDFYGLFLNLSRQFQANFLHLVRTAGWMIPFIVISFFYPQIRNIEGLLIFWVLGGIVTLFFHLWFTRSWRIFSANKIEPLFCWILAQFKKSKPVYFTSCLATIGQNINQFLITFFLGVELNGIYVFFTQVTAAASNLINTGVIQMARPKLVRAFKNLEPDYLQIYQNCMKNTAIMSFASALIMLPAMYIIVYYVVDKPLSQTWFPLFSIALLSYILSMIADAQNLLFYSQHRDDITLKTFIVNFISVIILGIILIPLLSLYGAVISVVLGVFLRITIQNKYYEDLKVKNV